MIRVIVILTLASLAACDYDPAPPAGDLPFFAYSIDAEFEHRLFDAVDIINRAAGCELTGVMPDEPYVQPVLVVPDDYFDNPFTLARAKVTSAFGHTERKHPIRIEHRGVDRDTAAITLAHEIGHTLGLKHADDGVMASFLGRASDEFNQYDAEYLSGLCVFLPIM